MPICYRPGGLASSARERTDAFVDGGVFDNNPLGLATTLFDLSKGPSKLQDVQVFYTNPMSFRGALQEAEALERRGLGANEGLAGTLAMIGGAMGAARHYELQSALRQQARDHELGAERTMRIFASSRASPIMGEMLGSFGAFLGRPFREYDFYSGVYDGVHMIAHEVVCGGKSDRRSACVTSAIEELITTLPFDQLAKNIVTWRRDLELAEQWVPVSATPGQNQPKEADHKRTILAAIHGAVRNTALRSSVPNACVRRGFPLGKAFCESGLESVLAVLRSENVWTAVAAEAGTCPPDKRAGSDRRAREYWTGIARTGDCFVDPAFKQLVQRREREVLKLVDRALERLRFAEETLQNRGAPQMDGWSETFDMLHRSTSARYRNGWSGILPSSFGPRRFGSLHDFIASTVSMLAPSHVSVGLMGDSETRPQLALGSRLLEWRFPVWYVASDLEFPNREDTTWAWDQRTHTAALGTYALPAPVVQSVELQILNVGPLPGGGRAERSWGAGLGFTFAMSKMRVDVRWTKVSGTVAQIGVNDVRGMLGWLIR